MVTLQLHILQQEALTTDKLNWHMQKQIGGKRFNHNRFCKYQVQTRNNKCCTLLRMLTLKLWGMQSKQIYVCTTSWIKSIVLCGCVVIHRVTFFQLFIFFKSKSCWKNLGHKITSSEACWKNSCHQLQACGLSYSLPSCNQRLQTVIQS